MQSCIFVGAAKSKNTHRLKVWRAWEVEGHDLVYERSSYLVRERSSYLVWRAWEVFSPLELNDFTFTYKFINKQNVTKVLQKCLNLN